MLQYILPYTVSEHRLCGKLIYCLALTSLCQIAYNLKQKTKPRVSSMLEIMLMSLKLFSFVLY